MGEICYHCLTNGIKDGKCQNCGASVLQRGMRETDLLPLGATLNNGSIIVGAKLGSSQFSVTYIARDSQYGLIALKEYYPKALSYRDARNRIVPKANSQETFNNYKKAFIAKPQDLNLIKKYGANVTPILLTLTENGTAYYGTEFISGINLYDWLMQQSAPLKPQAAYYLMRPLMKALERIRDAELYHRSIRTDSILLQKDSAGYMGVTPWLIDIERTNTPSEYYKQLQYRRIIKEFISIDLPDVFNQYRPSMDVYSFCATFYHLITKTFPVPVIDSVRKSMYICPPSKLNPEISGSVDTVLLNGMHITSKHFIRTMYDLERMLSSAVNNIHISNLDSPLPASP